MVDLSISIVTADVQLIVPCLKSIYETTKLATFEVYVAINQPEAADIIEVALRSGFPDTQLIRNTEVEGFSRSNNRILHKCRGRYVLLLNDDTVVLGSALERMVTYMDRHPGIGALGCKLLNPDGSVQWSCGKSVIHKFEYFRSGVLRTLLAPLVRDQFFDSAEEVSWVTGACMMVRAEAVKTVGPLDDRFYMYYEDGEWCYRMLKAGWKVLYYPEAEVIHLRSQTGKKVPAQTVSRYYQSRLYFFAKRFSAITCITVRLLTICDAMVGYIKSLHRDPATRNVEVLKAYVGAIKLALGLHPARGPDTAS